MHINTFNTPNLGNYSPYELTFGRKPKVLLNIESNPDIKVSKTFKEYYELLNKRIKYLQDILFKLQIAEVDYDKQGQREFPIQRRRLSLHYFSIN